MIYFTTNRTCYSLFHLKFRALIIIGFIIFSSVITRAQVNTGGNATTANHKKQVIGYLTNWDAWKAANAGLPAQGVLNHLNIDYGKYTILNYSFFGVASDGSLHSGDLRNKNIYQAGATQAPGDIFYVDPYSSWDLHLLFGELELIQHLNAEAVAKATAQGFQVQENGSTWSHPAWGLFNKSLPVPIHKPGGAPGVLELAHSKGVKVIASIGGWSMCKHFPEMAADPVKRQRFINDCVKLINTGFDGIDLDWEFPGPYAGMNFTGTQGDFANFSTLVQEIRNAIGPNKLITAAMSADPVKLQGFEWNKISNTMNYFNIMTYDFNGGWSNKAGHNAPLYNYDGAEAPTFNWKSTYDALVSYGVPKNKINMGSPFYGRGVVTSSTATLNGATTKRQETVQPDGPIQTCADYTNWPRDVYDGTPNYFYIKQVALGSGSGWTRSWDNQAKVPYLTKGNFFLSYDDEESIGHKAQFIVDNELAGTIIWTVFGDLEVSGSPTQFGTKLIRYPTVKSVLVNKINEVFAGGSTGLPTVIITSPANGTTVATGSNVTINATASDPGGSITQVEFLLNGTKVGEDASSPYSFTINNIAVGSHIITARAIDNANNTATSSVTITAGSNQPPIVSITAPSNGAVFTAPASITITANATDNGSVTKVEFFQGSTKLGEDTSSPYSFTWSNVQQGSYTLTAKATDNESATTTSAVITVTVNQATGGTCSGLTQYVNGSNYAAGAQVQHNSKKYECKVGGWCSLGGAYEPGVGWAWGDAWTDLGSCSGGSNANPSVAITSPTNNASFNASATVMLNATATDSDGTITKVEFYQGSTKLGEDTFSPYSFTWSNVAAGSYALKAVAIDNAGGVGSSAIVNITVNGNAAPSVSISSPANNATFTAPASITITASASDVKGSITKVEFYNGATKLGEDTSSPYSYSWTNVGADTYNLTARATDNDGLTSTSSTVTISVNAGGGCNNPQYVENGGYVAGSKVSNVSNTYECKGYPYTGWCNGPAWAYAPGTGTYWQDAWILVGACASARVKTADVNTITEEEADLELSGDEDGLSLYPNPGNAGEKNKVTFHFKDKANEVKVILRDINGSIVFEKPFTGVKQKLTVEFPSVTNGLYIIRVQGLNKSWVKKYIVN
ncbi:Ig-like domain-containing protein [Chryseosolibacter indicus]|uniref:chitinase n=1 Tax=Chryseosolibacter indicus TaxID=2782351 RepID=A0ABS5VJT5_9BACT|nr:Ig-like domain-containing protein [Chryseosolibacter indicus]MBT1701703.1 T9SS type A sorting domain-containing protein [Chryseosolibacter indicus]